MKISRSLKVALAGACLLVATSTAFSQASGLTRTLLGKYDVSIADREAVVARVEIPPGAQAGRHTHPGDEISFLSEGQFELLIDGQPARAVKAGESFMVPAGAVHDVRNTGAAPARVLAVYVVEKGKPLATPAP
jgi:quercetin dioxygenase-like cupin family protein